MFERYFLSGSPESTEAYREAVRQAAGAVVNGMPGRPYSGRSPGELEALLAGEICPARGLGWEAVLRRVETVIRNSVQVSHSHTAAHLHCPPLIPALAAEVVISALNQSMDSFDQAPSATMLEQSLIDWLRGLVGLPAAASGTFTAGGTQSNYMGLLLARDAYSHARLGWSVQERGLPPEAGAWRILCSEVAHFTVEKSAAQLGLGTASVVRVPVDDQFRMCPEALASTLRRLRAEGLRPIAIVATAGTTDFGSIDPLPEIASLARRSDAWLHVDAAYGGALLLSDRHRSQLAGIEAADSVSVDFHKLFWQPISCGAFLLRDAGHFDRIRLHAEYLNPESHQEMGIPDLVTRSILTTRRFDALKLWVCLQALGRETFGAMIDHTLDLAKQTAAAIREDPRLELVHPPTLGCVLFRYRPEDQAVDADGLNEAIRHRLLEAGTAVIGHTRVRGESCLKLTLMNPCARLDHIRDLLSQAVDSGRALECTWLAEERSDRGTRTCHIVPDAAIAPRGIRAAMANSLVTGCAPGA